MLTQRKKYDICDTLIYTILRMDVYYFLIIKVSKGVELILIDNMENFIFRKTYDMVG